jgi:GNAT superfamily N-acetyltransferase
VPTIVRPLEPRDVDALYRMIVELAEFEKIAHLVTTSPAKLAADAFGPTPQFSARVAETEGELVGYAVYSFTYYTFTGRWLYLDDLYVHESARGSGVGKLLLAAVADDAAARGCFGIQWFVLDWNESAIRFYDAMGARVDRAWLTEKVRGPEAIRAFQARLRAS